MAQTPRDYLINVKFRFSSFRKDEEAGEAKGLIVRLKMYARRFFGEGNAYEPELDKVGFESGNRGPIGSADPALKQGCDQAEGIIDTMIEELELIDASPAAKPFGTTSDPQSRVEAFFVLHPEQEFLPLTADEQKAILDLMPGWEEILTTIRDKKEITQEELDAVLIEMARLKETLPSATRGKVYRAVAKIFSVGKTVSNNPYVLRLLVWLMEKEIASHGPALLSGLGIN